GLRRLAVLRGEGGAQDFVAPGNFLQRELEGVDIEGPAESDGGGDVVEGAAGLPLVKEPQPLLRKRERKVIFTVGPSDWVGSRGPPRSTPPSPRPSALRRERGPAHPCRRPHAGGWQREWRAVSGPPGRRSWSADRHQATAAPQPRYGPRLVRRVCGRRDRPRRS